MIYLAHDLWPDPFALDEPGGRTRWKCRACRWRGPGLPETECEGAE